MISAVASALPRDADATYVDLIDESIDYGGVTPAAIADMRARVSEALAKEVRHLRDKSNIEYVGDFANAPKDKPIANPEAFQLQPAQQPAAPNNFDKGIRGLR